MNGIIQNAFSKCSFTTFAMEVRYYIFVKYISYKLISNTKINGTREKKHGSMQGVHFNMILDSDCVFSANSVVSAVVVAVANCISFCIYFVLINIAYSVLSMRLFKLK